MDYRLIAVGASRGGTQALAILLAALPGDLGATVVVMLHRGEGSGEPLIEFLQTVSTLRLREAQDKDELKCGAVYLDPAGYHLMVEKDNLALSTDAPVSWARPSIDVLFESVANAWTEQAIRVVLTGANSDGAHGLAPIKLRGGMAVVQQPSEAEYPAMPVAAIAASPVDYVLTLAKIPPLLAAI